MEVLQFVKSYFDGEAVVVKEVGGWKASWEEEVERVAQASRAERRDWAVRSGLIIVERCRVALMGVF